MLELYTNNLRMNYLSYKKVLIVSPREFVYLKYTGVVEGGEYWEVAFSVEREGLGEEKGEKKVRGEIVLSASRVVEKEEGIEVQVYMEVDMRLAVSAKIVKNQAVNEIRKYVERCERYVKENYRK